MGNPAREVAVSGGRTLLSRSPVSAGVDLVVGEGADARAAAETGSDGGRGAADSQLIFTCPFACAPIHSSGSGSIVGGAP